MARHLPNVHLVQGDTELISAPAYWMAAQDAPSTNTQVSAVAIGWKRPLEPGRWIGYGAKEAFLTGAVDPADFADPAAGAGADALRAAPPTSPTDPSGRFPVLSAMIPPR